MPTSYRIGWIRNDVIVNANHMVLHRSGMTNVRNSGMERLLSCTMRRRTGAVA